MFLQDIEKEEDHVREKIRTLEQQLQDLNVHKQEYHKRCTDIEKKLQKEETDLNMVKATISEIQSQKDKLEFKK